MLNEETGENYRLEEDKFIDGSVVEFSDLT